MKLNDFKNKKLLAKLFENYSEYIYEEIGDNKNYLQAIIQKEEELDSTLSNKQKKIYKELEQLKEKDRLDMNKKMFIFAFTFAVKVMFEALT